MKTLNELIEEQEKKFDEQFILEPATDTRSGTRLVCDPQFAKDFFKRALKEIALQSIEAGNLKEAEKETPIQSRDDYSHGWNAAREEAKQRAGVFLEKV